MTLAARWVCTFSWQESERTRKRTLIVRIAWTDRAVTAISNAEIIAQINAEIIARINIHNEEIIAQNYNEEIIAQINAEIIARINIHNEEIIAQN